MTWRKSDPQCNEAEKCKWDIVPYTRGRGLEVGCGAGKVFQHFIGIDNAKDAKLFQIPISADIIAEADDLSIFADGSMNYVFSSHVLEHIKDYKKTLKEWWRVIKDGGHLVLYLPHADFYPNIGQEGSNPDHVHDFLPDDIASAMREIGGWDLVKNEERDAGREYSFFQVYKKRQDKAVVESWKNPKPEKTCALLRFGAWGDVIQVTSLLPSLKDDGYHITLYTSARGAEVVKHEPLIDEIVIQDEDQVPNLQLGEYVDHLRGKYDRLIDLSESVEGMFLSMPGRISYKWEHAARHDAMNKNYGEMIHKIAAVPYIKPLSRFVPTGEEIQWAKKTLKEIGGSARVLWVVTGSAIHKVYPHMDAAIDGLIASHSDIRIITVGDERCREVIEPAWADKTNVVRRSGQWSIRQTMTIAKFCDVVIGPETGVLNAVAMEPVHKVVMLSHSSIENLTRDWLNTVSLHSTKAACYPCHKMIYKFDQCNMEPETKTAKCMHDLHPNMVRNAIAMCLPKKEVVA